MNRIWSEFRGILEQSINNVDGFKNRARKKVTEQCDIHITDMMIGNSPEPSIPDVLFCYQILFRQVILGSISSGSLLIPRQRGNVQHRKRLMISRLAASSFSAVM